MKVETINGETLRVTIKDDKTTFRFEGPCPRAYAVRRDSSGSLEVAKQTPSFYSTDARVDLHAELVRLNSLGVDLSQALS